MAAGRTPFSDSVWKPAATGPDDPAPRRRMGAARWLGWRLRLLVVLALLGCLGIFALLRGVAQAPHLDAAWRTNAAGQVELARTGQAQLQPLVGQVLVGLGPVGGPRLPADALLLQRSARWVVSDLQRQRMVQQHDQLASVLAQPAVALAFANGQVVELRPMARGFSGPGMLFWLLSALALVLYLLTAVVVLAQPEGRNLLFGLMTLCQTGNLLLIAVESAQGLGLPPGFAPLDLVARVGLDAVFCAAIVHGATLYPRPVPARGLIAGAGWLAAAALLVAAASGLHTGLWWWTQAVMLASGAAAVAVLTWSYRRELHPYAMVLRRFGAVTTGTLALLTLAVALASRQPGMQHTVAAVGSVIWYVFVVLLLLMAPFVARTHNMVREFAMAAGVSTVAFSLDLLFVAVFALGPLTSIGLALFLSLGLYAVVRQWVLNQMMGSNMLSTERMFESLYRVAREVEAAPDKLPEHLSRLLLELFEPLELARQPKALAMACVAEDGAVLEVPVPNLPGTAEPTEPGAAARGSIVLRFARRGRRVFTDVDARLANRMLEQLARAVAYDRAVEQGRSEERTRIAQDLHDDIGARLLTLMYKAQTPEMEEYIRHTLQDLKTLTRGLAAASHPLSHAAAEWKADLAQRLTAAHCELGWSFSIDQEVNLTVVQWSALTRVLRELANNIIAHARATRVEVAAQYERGRFQLQVSDDGQGRDPQAWSHGLGLGGVRKRVKLLGGEVRWRENNPRGIVCELRVPQLGERR